MFDIAVSDLEIFPIRRQANVRPLRVPLSRTDGQSDIGAAFDLFLRGCVWEDEPYGLRFDVRTNRRIQRVTFSTGGNQGLWMRHTYRPAAGQYEYIRTWHVETDDSNERPYPYTHPFCSCGGFVRIKVLIEFSDGYQACFTTRDIVSLNEPKADGSVAESGKAANVRNMFHSLMKPDNNVAARWMFSTAACAGGDEEDSSSMLTDWAYEAFERTMCFSSDALDLVYDALDEASDAFPNEVATPDAPGKGMHDTRENQLIRALLVSICRRQEQVTTVLAEMLAETTRTCGLITALVERAEMTRRCEQSLPAAVVFTERQKHEQELLAQALDLSERARDALADFDDPETGTGPVTEVPFEVPPKTGLFAEDATYIRLRWAFRFWAELLCEPLVRRELTLHEARPDNIFEYAAQHKLLSTLHEGGFVENQRYEHPIEHYHYSLEDESTSYVGERRSANTYHLTGRDPRDGHRVDVDLLFQPVIYADEREENGITLHRVPLPEADEPLAFWTPDYLLRVTKDGVSRTFVLDAKYCSAKGIPNKLDECVDKYIDHVADRYRGKAGTGVSGVVLLVGKLDAPRFTVMGNGTQESPLKAIVPMHTRAGKMYLRELFNHFGTPIA